MSVIWTIEAMRVCETSAKVRNTFRNRTLLSADNVPVVSPCLHTRLLFLDMNCFSLTPSIALAVIVTRNTSFAGLILCGSCILGLIASTLYDFWWLGQAVLGHCAYRRFQSTCTCHCS